MPIGAIGAIGLVAIIVLRFDLIDAKTHKWRPITTMKDITGYVLLHSTTILFLVLITTGII